MFFGIIVLFLLFWFLMFSFQFRSKKGYNDKVHIGDYSFYSNTIFKYPRWIVYCLFFNNKCSKFPIILLLGQFVNYIMFMIFCIRFLIAEINTDFIIPFLKIWIILYVIVFCLIYIDYEIWRIKHKNDINYRF